MSKIATRLEDIGDERDQAVFMATVKVFFNGDFQAALDHYNKSAAELDEHRRIRAKIKTPSTAEVHLRIPHQ
jgi:hypothetical protein